MPLRGHHVNVLIGDGRLTADRRAGREAPEDFAVGDLQSIHIGVFRADEGHVLILGPRRADRRIRGETIQFRRPAVIQRPLAHRHHNTVGRRQQQPIECGQDRKLQTQRGDVRPYADWLRADQLLGAGIAHRRRQGTDRPRARTGVALDGDDALSPFLGGFPLGFLLTGEVVILRHSGGYGVGKVRPRQEVGGEPAGRRGDVD